MNPDGDPQLELFRVSQTPSATRRAAIGALSLRYDHAVLLAIAGLIGISVVFACGVERGKRLALEERLIVPTVAMTAEPPAPSPTVAAAEQPSSPSIAEAPTPAVQPKKPATKTASPPAAPKTSPKAKPAKAPIKVASTKSGFAIQVVTYTTPGLAQQELRRLKAAGESAFLVPRDGRVALYIGPFPSRENATAKLASLKRQYQDCFVRTL